MATFGRWTLKTVLYGGEDLLDRTITFEPEQHLRDVQLVFSDQRTEMTFRVGDEHGQPTRDYVAIVFPTDKARWTQLAPYVRTYVPVPAELVTTMSPGSAPGGARTPMLPAPPRRESLGGLRPGEYYAVAIDDIEAEASRDPAVLEKLVSRAVRVILTPGATIEVPLQLIKLADVVPNR
jgi:hypothetical protein